MPTAPLVSVVMPVYNVETYLREAIESILNQTFSDFEFIIIEDPSTEEITKILEKYAERDKRIRLIHNSRNLGLVRSLNKGLKQARGIYIARQDADDISLLDRLEIQVRFLERHPEVGVVGTWIALLDKEGKQTDILRKPHSPFFIKWSLLFGNCLAHSSVMMRLSLVEENEIYKTEMVFVEDYDLWARLSEKTLLANLPKVLCLIRLHEQRTSTQHFELQKKSGRLVMRQLIAKLLGKDIPEALLKSLQGHEVLKTQEELGYSARLITQLYKAFITQNKLNAVERVQIAENAANRLIHIALQNVEHSPVRAVQAMLLALSINWRVLTRSRALAIRKFIKKLSLSILKNNSYRNFRFVHSKTLKV